MPKYTTDGMRGKSDSGTVPENPTNDNPNGNGPEFGKVPHAAIAAGLIRDMKPADAMVYLAIAGHACQGGNFQARLALDTIADLTGLSRRAVCFAVKRLESLGAIARHHDGDSGGRGHANTYDLRRNGRPTAKQGTHVHPLSNGQTVNARSPFRPLNSERTFTPKEIYREKTTEAPHGRTPDRSSGTATEGQSSAAADRREGEKTETKPTGPDPKIIDKLNRHGIDPPTDRKLLTEFPGMTCELIDKALASAGPSARGGARVKLIRQHMAGLIERQAKREACQAEVERQRVETRQAEDARRESDRQKLQHIAEIIDGLTDADLADLKAQVIDRLERSNNGWTAAQYNRWDPRENPTLREAIVKIIDGMTEPDGETFPRLAKTEAA